MTLSARRIAKPLPPPVAQILKLFPSARSQRGGRSATKSVRTVVWATARRKSAPASFPACVHFLSQSFGASRSGIPSSKIVQKESIPEDMVMLIHDHEVGVLAGLSNALQDTL
jgi:hypothetical protein